MLLAVICLRGLNPKPSYVRRYISQSPASGCWSRSSVTVAYDVGSACRPCATRSAIGRLSQNLRYDKVGFLFENRYAITRISAVDAWFQIQSCEKALQAATDVEGLSNPAVFGDQHAGVGGNARR